MNKDNKKVSDAREASCRSEEPLRNEKETVPGQQIGLYSKADKQDVRQMVRMLNSPEEQSQKDRG
ncbi:MAG: hypothetical protein K2L60_04120 [Bacteroides sp.]|nr:hypothetical protein [Bacteroides sp.]